MNRAEKLKFNAKQNKIVASYSLLEPVNGLGITGVNIPVSEAWK